MVEFVGKYNLDFPGKAGKNGEYEMLIVSEFDDNEQEVARKLFYMRNSVETAVRLLNNELIIAELMEKANNSRIRLARRTLILNAN